MFSLRIIALLLYPLIVVAPSALAQMGSFSTLPLIRTFTPFDYQASNQNWAIDQSKEGYLFVGNNAGILEFDGTNWGQHSLPARQVPRSIATDDSGRIFTGGYETFGYWERNDLGALVFQELGDKVGADLIREEIWHILITERGVFFQSFSTLFFYNNKEVVTIRPPGNIMFLQEVNGKCYIQVIDGGIYEFKSDFSFELLPNTWQLSAFTVAFLLSAPNGSLLIGTNNGGCFLYDDGEITNWNHPTNSVLAQNQLNKGIQLSSGGYVFGTVLNGVYIYDDQLELLYQINKNKGLQNNTILSIKEDWDGNLWLGLDKGIDMIQLSNPVRYYKDQQGKIGSIYAAEFAEGKLYVGSNQGLFYLDEKSESPEFQLVSGTQGQVWDLLYADGLLCGHNKGTYLIGDAAIREISDVAGGWMLVKVPGKHDELLQGTYSGIVKYRRNTSDQWELTGRIEGFSEPVKQLYFDKDGYLWVAHPQRGLIRLLLDADLQTATELKSFGFNEGLQDHHKVKLLTFRNTFSVISNCLYKYNADSILFSCYSLPGFQGFSWLKEVNQTLFAVKDGVVWIRRGEVMVQQPSIRLIEDFERVVYFPNWQGGIYFFCMEGGFAILPESGLPLIGLDNRKGRLQIKKLAIFNGSSSETIDLSKSEMKFASSENNLTFQFSLPYFDQSPEFRYRLIGFDSQWTEYSTQSSATFQNLSPGKYVFELETRNSGEIVRYPFEITAPWYLRGWAMAGYMILFLLILWGVYQYLQFMLLKEREAFERKRLEEEKFREEQKARERLEQEVALKSRELAHAAMSQVRKNEVLSNIKIELKGAIKDPAKARIIVSKIDEEIESDQDWESFVEVFNHVHDDFFKKLQIKHPSLTPGDLKLAAYLRLNLSTKEIAPLLNLSVRSVENKRYRLRKKMGLGEEDNLTEYVLSV